MKPGIAFSFGLVLGVCFSFTIVYILQQQQSQKLLQTKTPIAKTEESLSELGQQMESEQSAPTFEFYQILPDMELNVSDWESEQPAAETTAQAEIIKENQQAGYVLQLGSFRNFESADQVKAKLALLGINANIQQVVINGENVFHRVRVGPYNTTGKLEEAQQRLLANDLNFSILKLSIEDL